MFYFSFIYIYINNKTPHLTSLKNQNRRASLGWPEIKLLRGALTSLRSTNHRRLLNRFFFFFGFVLFCFYLCFSLLLLSMSLMGLLCDRFLFCVCVGGGEGGGRLG